MTVLDQGWQLTIPESVKDIASFRQWRDSDDFPEEGNIWWLKGKVWADMSKEQLFTHNVVKLEVGMVLRQLVKKDKLGVVFTDGALLSNFAGDFAGQPDCTYVSAQTLASDRIRMLEGQDNGLVEIQGSPDVVVEVVSKGSVKKDEEVLMNAYWEADIPEYWLIDVRGDSVRFDLYRHSSKRYVLARKQGGWVKSKIFSKSFRLVTHPGPATTPDYTLEVR